MLGIDGYEPSSIDFLLPDVKSFYFFLHDNLNLKVFPRFSTTNRLCLRCVQDVQCRKATVRCDRGMH